MKNRGLFSITQVARLYGIHTDRLRHYDKIGLLKPAWRDPDTGVRYYSLSPDHDKLGTILELRDLGLSLGEISDYFQNRNLRKSCEALKAKQAEIDREIERLAERRGIIGKKVRALDAALNTNYPFGEVRRCHLPRRQVLASPLMTPSLVDLNREFILLSQQLEETAPVVGTDRIGISFEFDAAGELRMRAGMVLKNCPDEGSLFEELDEAEYLCMYRFGDALDIEGSWNAMRQYAKDNGLPLASELIEIFVIDQSVTDVPSENVFDLQIRIRDAS